MLQLIFNYFYLLFVKYVRIWMIQYMSGTKRYRPSAEETALRITVLDTEQGHARSPGIISIANSQEKKQKKQRWLE